VDVRFYFRLFSNWLVEKLVDEVGFSFEEVLFVQLIAVSLERQIGRLREEGFAGAELIARLTGVGAYQLQRIRSFTELLLQLPEDLRAAELSSGIAARRQMIFLPLLARARAELHQLQQLALSFAR
jgi:hypothetical protein